MELALIQEHLAGFGLDGWLLYDFGGMNPIAEDVAGVGSGLLTRRWFCLVPSEGQPRWLVSRVEVACFDGVPGEVTAYTGWKALPASVSELLGGTSKVAMEYVPNGEIPYVSRVDAGTMELVRSAGVEVVSSADLVQACTVRWTPVSVATHLEASIHLNVARLGAFDLVAREIGAGKRVTEYDVQQHILRYFDANGMVADDPPIVAAGRHTCDPHYQPTSSSSAVIGEGDLLLVDLWAKMDDSESVYADITWMAFVGSTVPGEYARVFETVAGARDLAVEFIRASVADGRTIRGFEVDDVARAAIIEAGHGDRFVHRTGHNLGSDVHGSGVNFDNLETHDARELTADIGCTIEPGIYLDGFGVRSEIDIHIGPSRAQITTVPVQERIEPLLGQR